MRDHESPEERRPLILEIKGNSLDDGPGIRTVVFFKGCPLSCTWCHNPESKRSGPEISFDPGECAGCDTCISVCEEGALDRDNPSFIDRKRCTLCFKCVLSCPAEALSRVGRFMTVEEVAVEVEKDVPFFKTSGGGVTLSGGEPTLYMEYASGLLSRLEQMEVHTIVETCGHFNFDDFKEMILPLVNSIYFDLKVFDPDAHRKYCGTSNELILENFIKLWTFSEDGGPEILPRIPLIPGITATDGNLAALADFLRECGARRVALLEYNPMWVEKSKNIGKRDLPGSGVNWTSWMDRSEVKRCKSLFDKFELV